MKRSELKALIRETIEEIMKDDFAPLGVAEEKLTEKAPPGMKDDVKKAGNTPEAYKAAWKKFYSQHGDKNKASKQIKEMWLATEGAGKHDETDMSNPEEKREVELAKKARDAAEEILKMHGK
jgi:hypothetical protein